MICDRIFTMKGTIFKQGEISEKGVLLYSIFEFVKPYFSCP